MAGQASWWVAVAACLSVIGAGTASAVTDPAHDYPTDVRADYVLGCMAANGNTRESLTKCACSLDTIARLMPYDDYEKAATALSLRQSSLGGRGGAFVDAPPIKLVIEELRKSQAEADLQCF
jgi:hypothetical protein